MTQTPVVTETQVALEKEKTQQRIAEGVVVLGTIALTLGAALAAIKLDQKRRK